MLRLFLLCAFALVGMQVPQVVKNYQIGLTAVVSELRGDYLTLTTMARDAGLTVPQLLAKAKNTPNPYANAIVNIVADKMPRYLALQQQQQILAQGEIFRTVKVVFWQHDKAIWQNVLATYEVGLYLHLDPAWYLFIALFSLLMVLFLQGIWSLGKFFLRSRKKRHRGRFLTL